MTFFRKNTKAIVWTVVIAFVLWGALTFSTQFQDRARSAGKIFGKEVSYRDYLAAGKTVQMFKAQNEAEVPAPAEQIEGETWVFLVLMQEAKRQKIEVTDEEVRTQIVGMIGQNGELGVTPEQYAQWIQGVFREQPNEFENRIRENLRVRKLVEKVRAGAGDHPEETLKQWQTDLITRAKIEIHQPSTE